MMTETTRMVRKSNRPLLLAQLAVTLLVLWLVKGTIVKTALLFGFWALTFGRLAPREALFAVVACVIFSIMDVLATLRNRYVFEHPDLFGLPAYELLLWGFYLLHGLRMLEGPTPEGRRWLPWLLVVPFTACFSLDLGHAALLVSSASVLLVVVTIFHEPYDLAYAGYFVVMGALVELVGVRSGAWSYPGFPAGGFPAWFACMWGGVGLFLRRLALPLLRAR